MLLLAFCRKASHLWFTTRILMYTSTSSSGRSSISLYSPNASTERNDLRGLACGQDRAPRTGSQAPLSTSAVENTMTAVRHLSGTWLVRSSLTRTLQKKTHCHPVLGVYRELHRPLHMASSRPFLATRCALRSAISYRSQDRLENEFSNALCVGVHACPFSTMPHKRLAAR